MNYTEGQSIPNQTQDPEEVIQQKIETILKRLQIEKDEEGNIVLYHVTPFSNFLKIKKDNIIKPGVDTGNKIWSLANESLKSNIYLATKSQAKNIALTFKNEFGGSSFYILEVHVPTDGLQPDEDSLFTKTWYDSLDTTKMCSSNCNISNFKVFEKIEYLPSLAKRQEIIASEKTDQEIEKMMEEEIRKGKEGEEKLEKVVSN